MNNAAFRKKLSSFTLLELLVVAAIVAVIAAFAIPGYTNYVTQTKVNALWQQAEAAKLEVESMYLKQNMAVSSITVDSGTTEYTTSNTDFVKCITIQGGIVAVEGDPTKFNNLSIWIAWEPTVTAESLTWTCIYSPDAAPYVANVSNTCAMQSCSTYSGWGTPTTVDTQTFWYSGTLSQADVSSAFANNCETTASMSGCSACYNFTNSDTEQRYMTFSLSNATYNYQGALGSDPNWSSYSSWAYQYNYTIVTQSCMDQTQSASTCSNTDPFSSDPGC